MRYATLAYGKHDAVYRQATMLIVSLLAHAPALPDIVVVTDRPDRFAWFANVVKVRVLTPGELKTWMGANPFSMRQKLEAARAVMPSEGELAFLDADTLASTDLGAFAASLASRTLLMHKREFELGANQRAGNRKLWGELDGRMFGGWQFSPNDSMWNSGVLALSVSDAGLLDDALALYDSMAEAGIRHFATEQLVVGTVFGRTGRLRPAERWFVHYWGNKDNFDLEINRRIDQFHRRRATPQEAAEAFRKAPILLPPEVRPHKLAKIRRWLRRDVK